MHRQLTFHFVEGLLNRSSSRRVLPNALYRGVCCINNKSICTSAISSASNSGQVPPTNKVSGKELLKNGPSLHDFIASSTTTAPPEGSSDSDVNPYVNPESYGGVGRKGIPITLQYLHYY